MSDELKQAEESWRNSDGFASCDPSECFERVYLIAQAHMAEYPADDGEAIDEAWLRSVGFSPNGWIIKGSKRLKVDRNPMSNDPRISWGFTLQDEYWHAQGFVSDRRLVRKLAAALGIALKEGTAS